MVIIQTFAFDGNETYNIWITKLENVSNSTSIVWDNLCYLTPRGIDDVDIMPAKLPASIFEEHAIIKWH